MYARGYTASNDGNISVRIDAARLLMTPKSVCKGFMTPDMMCVTDLEGRKLQGDRDPSSEMLMHLEVYRQRPDVQAVGAEADADVAVVRGGVSARVHAPADFDDVGAELRLGAHAVRLYLSRQASEQK